MHAIVAAKGAELMYYIHERPEWPDFYWDMDTLAGHAEINKEKS